MMIPECVQDKIIFNNQIIDCREVNDTLVTRGTIYYEVIRVIEGICLFVEDHLERFFNTLDKAGVPPVFTKMEIENKLEQLIKANNVKNGNIKFIYNTSRDNAFIAYFTRHKYPSAEDYIHGVKCGYHQAERPSPTLKKQNLILREKIDNILNNSNYHEMLLVSDNKVTEGSRSNLFFIKNHAVYATPGKYILPGITRQYVLKCCKENNIPIHEEIILKEHVKDFDSCFISGTSPKILPIKEIENIKFSISNPILREIMARYNQKTNQYIQSKKQ